MIAFFSSYLARAGSIVLLLLIIVLYIGYLRNGWSAADAKLALEAARVAALSEQLSRQNKAMQAAHDEALRSMTAAAVRAKAEDRVAQKAVAAIEHETVSSKCEDSMAWLAARAPSLSRW